MIRTGCDIWEEVEEGGKQGTAIFGAKKYINVDDLLIDLNSWLEAGDYKELKQCVEDFISELKEG